VKTLEQIIRIKRWRWNSREKPVCRKERQVVGRHEERKTEKQAKVRGAGGKAEYGAGGMVAIFICLF
jgi:hypothetical protein